MRKKVLALDLEGTLISNAVSQFPRPGLNSFLEFCNNKFERIVLFTTVRESKARDVISLLIRENLAPKWFGEIEYIDWSGPNKDLSFIPDAIVDECLIVDDQSVYILPDQKDHWVEVSPFDYPYSEDDTELLSVKNKIIELISDS